MALNSVVGTWSMNHDGWTGTLVINPPDQVLNGLDGECTYSTTVLDGRWTSSAGQQLAVRGTLGGHDPQRRTGEKCPASAHRITFTIAFPGPPPQPFEGYLFTHGAPVMAGYTWWQGQPFGWHASR